MANGNLEAYEILIPFGHTYVKSDRGHIWPCHGRYSGGRLILTVHGNVDQADCLAQVDKMAGISYGINGMCHQIANRILLPTGKTVFDGDPSLRALTFMFGIYGRIGFKHYSPSSQPWIELVECQQKHSHP